jgi:alkylation response protein AidB-like acyl-CoA dehydrogenase
MLFRACTADRQRAGAGRMRLSGAGGAVRRAAWQGASRCACDRCAGGTMVKLDERRYIKAARQLAPQIAAAGEQHDRDRRLQPAVVEAMAAAGLFRLLLPRSIGGGEASLRTLLRTLEVVAAADGSTGWCLAQNAISAMQVAPFLPPELVI